MRSDFGDPHMLLSDIYLSYRRNDLASKAALKAISLVEQHGAHGMMPKKMMLAEIHALNGKAMYRWGLDLARSPKRKKRASAGRYFQTARRELQTALELNPESPQGLELREEMAAGGF